jgi:hypothetical protein
MIVPAGSIFFVSDRVRELKTTHIMTIYKNNKASIRISDDNLNHHLFFNNGIWWLHYTAYPTAITSHRIRQSLKTRDVELARDRRDAVLKDLFESEVQ